MIKTTCSVCKKEIYLPTSSEEMRLPFTTNYWNVEHRQNYCSAECSLKAHQGEYNMGAGS